MPLPLYTEFNKNITETLTITESMSITIPKKRLISTESIKPKQTSLNSTKPKIIHMGDI